VSNAEALAQAHLSTAGIVRVKDNLLLSEGEVECLTDYWLAQYEQQPKIGV
jgi:hypothetical protein